MNDHNEWIKKEGRIKPPRKRRVIPAYFFLKRNRYEGCDKEQEKNSTRRVVHGQHQKREGREQKKHREIKDGHAKDLSHASLLRYLKLKNESYIFLFCAYVILS